jgi:ribosomal peptide maturation radical SAM protein 1
MRIVLATMPWHLLETPCLPLGLLRARLSACRVTHEVEDYYGNLTWAEHLYGAGLTLDDYEHVSDRGVWHAMGEWVFAGALQDDPEWAVASYRAYLAERGVDPGRSFAMRGLAERFVDRAAADILACEPDLVGFTTTFQQNVASLAVARRLKQRRPEVVVVFGGGNCHGPMGPALHRNFPFVDYVINGEGEVAFVGLVDALAEADSATKVDSPTGGGTPGGSGTLAGIAGLTWRRADGGSEYNGPAAMVPMHLVPRPDYSAWQAALDASPLRSQLRPVLIYEAARGCWWGEKHHCTFCGLNGTTMKFRAKSADEVFADLVHLISRHEILDVVTVDNILDVNYLRDLLPRLEAAGWDLLIRYEVKANLRADQLAQLRDAGVRHLQPGLESLSSAVLRLMDKGVHATQNVQVLRDAEDYELTIDWNWLYGFPGESQDDYRQVVAQVPALVHLQPPAGATRILLERFSPYFDRPELGFPTRWPAEMYHHVYNLPDHELLDLCYQFESEPRGIGGPAEVALRSACHSWQCGYRDSALVSTATGEGTLIADARVGWPRREHWLREPALARGYDLLSRPRAVTGLADELSGEGYRVNGAEVARWLDAWRADGLVFTDDSRAVALATRGQPLRVAQPATGP